MYGFFWFHWNPRFFVWHRWHLGRIVKTKSKPSQNQKKVLKNMSKHLLGWEKSPKKNHIPKYSTNPDVHQSSLSKALTTCPSSRKGFARPAQPNWTFWALRFLASGQVVSFEGDWRTRAEVKGFHYIYLDPPVSSIFWRSNPQKTKAFSNQNKGHLGSTYMINSSSRTLILLEDLGTGGTVPSQH